MAVSANDGRSRDRAHRRSRSHRHHRSSSVDSRSDESEDESLRGVESLYYRGRRIRAEDQYAVDMTASVKATHGTFVSWGSDNKFYSKRNGSEQELLCAVIDCMNSGHHQVALELLCRRLAGVLRAEETGQWDYCNAISLHNSSRLVGDRLDRANNDIAKLRAATAKSGGNGGNGGAGRGRGGNDKRGGDKSAAQK